MEGPSARFDRYEVLAPLGAGGMGEVVKARALGPHGFEKIVAIKRIRAEWAAEEAMAERFIREARIAARLQHANIVQVFDFGRHGEELFIVMEYVDGQSLDHILAALSSEGKRPTLAQSLQIALDVARALDCAHNLHDDASEPVGVIHRDVSPANVLVSRQGLVKLTDFGIAAWSSNQGRTSLVAGKPLYMAPEQLRGEVLDGRADLFAVGVLLYEMLTGERPWKGVVDTSPGSTLASMGYRPPSALATGLPAELDALFERLLAPDPKERLGSARELTKEIVSLSYRSQIVLDPNELTPLVTEPGTEAHAPTLPRYVSKVQTLVATGVSPDGVTMLQTADDDRGGPAPSAQRGLPAWVWIAAALIVLGAGVAAALSIEDERASPVAVAEVPEEVDAPAQHEEVGVSPAQIVAPREASAEITDAGAAPDPLAPPEVEEAATPEVDDAGARPTKTGRRRAPSTEAREQARAPAAPRFGASGELDVFSRPWAEIWIDGARQPENAPARGLHVAAGRHQVRLVNPVLGLSAERTVDVPAGGRAQLRVFLDRTDDPGE